MNALSELPASEKADLPRPKTKRLVYLDALRGLLLVLMAVNHIPSDLQIATDHPFGFVSAAEGFVFLAGLMAGLVYTKKLDKSGAPAMQASSVARAFTIYRYHLAAFAVVFIWMLGYRAVTGSPPPGTPDQVADSPWRTLMMVPLLLAQPSLFDILPMYCGFILLIPWLVRRFEAGQTSLVLLGSFSVWALTNAWCPQIPLMTAWLQMGAFNVCAWQILFVFGTAFGHAWARKESLLPAPRATILVPVVLAATFLYAMRHAFIPTIVRASELGWLTNKNNLAPLRLIDSALLFYLVHLVVTRFPRIASWHSLAFLGKSSLVVFAVHVVVASGIHSFPNIFATTSTGRWTGTSVMIILLYVTAAIHQKLPVLGSRLSGIFRARKLTPPIANESDGSRALDPTDSLPR